jgi:hypothetical protein
MQSKFPNVEKLALNLNQHTLAVALKFSVLSAIIIAFYLQDLTLIFRNAISDEATYHILAIPFLFGYLLYRKRAMVNAALKQENKTVSSAFSKYFVLSVGIYCALQPFWLIGQVPTPSRR